MVQFLDVFNIIAAVVKFKPMDFKPEDVDKSLDDLGLDSLDKLMCTIYVCELYGISEEVGKGVVFKTIYELQDFAYANKTKEPESLEEVEKTVK